MRITNKFKLPDCVVAAVTSDSYKCDSDISVTSLISAPRIYQLKKRHGEELEEDVTDMIYRLLGNNTHHILESISAQLEDVIAEKRYYGDFLGWSLSGQIDLYETKTGTLSDHKVTSVWSVLNGVKPDFEKQLNIYAHLMRLNGVEGIKKLQIINYLRDWSKRKANDKGYAPCQVAVQEIKMRDPAKVEQLINNRIKYHQECEVVPDDSLPECTPQERWARPTIFAVMKKGRKSALRLCDSLPKAEAWISLNEKGDEIVVRPGENVRCMGYCNLTKFCNQYKSGGKEYGNY